MRQLAAPTGAAGERIEAERAEQQRQHQRVAGIFFEMRFGAADGKFRLALDHGGHDRNMCDFARRCAGRKLHRLRGHGTRFGAFHVELVKAGAADMRQRKAGIFRDCLVERGFGSVPGRQHAVRAVPVMRRGAIRGGGERQIISVPVHFSWSLAQGENGKPSRDPSGIHNIVAHALRGVEWMPIRR